MTTKEFVKSRRKLFWDVHLDGLTDDAVLERILNYGDFKDVKKILSIIGIKKSATIFRKQIKQKRNNYRPVIKNYFKLYFDKYAGK